MTGIFGNSLPWPLANKPKSTAAETTPGGSESTKLVAVAVNLNPAEAAIIKGRLESEDILAVIQQEAMGSVLGLTVGPLGSANVLVPEPLAERAVAILAETFDGSDETFWDDDEEPDPAEEVD